MYIRFWGVRGSIPTPGPATVRYGGNTSCVEVRVGDQIIILDAGTGLRLLGRELVAEFGRQPLDLVLLLTHTHWDHIQGLPFFSGVHEPQNRVRILGYEGARRGLHTVLNGQMEDQFFPIPLPVNVTVEELGRFSFTLGQVRVQAFRACHPGMCVGYRLTAFGSSIAFFPDNEVYQANSRTRQPRVPKGLAAKLSLRQNLKLIRFLRNVEVLVMDTQYDHQEYQEHIGWGHGCLDEVVNLALAAKVKKLFLFHHDPDHDDAKIAEMTAHARKLVAANKASLQIAAAREGLTIRLSTRRVS